MLSFDEQQQYRELIVTQWSEDKLSYDGKFSIYYGYSYNTLYIDKVEKIPINSTSGLICKETLVDFQIEETGFLYGTWDEQNNIWLYGEDIGIKLYSYAGNETWEETRHFDTNNVPYALKMVIESVATNKNAILFNPANANLFGYGLNGSAYTANMTQYIVQKELLSETTIFGVKLGPVSSARVPTIHTVWLKKQHSALTICGQVNNHLMGAVKSALEKGDYVN